MWSVEPTDFRISTDYQESTTNIFFQSHSIIRGNPNPWAFLPGGGSIKTTNYRKFPQIILGVRGIVDEAHGLNTDFHRLNVFDYNLICGNLLIRGLYIF